LVIRPAQLGRITNPSYEQEVPSDCTKPSLGVSDRHIDANEVGGSFRSVGPDAHRGRSLLRAGNGATCRPPHIPLLDGRGQRGAGGGTHIEPRRNFICLCGLWLQDVRATGGTHIAHWHADRLANLVPSSR